MMNWKTKMNKLCVLALTLGLAACGEPFTYKTVKMENICKPGTTEARAKFTLQCITNANPHSDEEPEDWLYICKNMAEQTYCPELPVELTKTTKDGSKSYYDVVVARRILE